MSRMPTLPARRRTGLLVAVALCAGLLAAPASAGPHAPASSEPERFTGRVVGVRDGDSLVVLADRREVEIRLAEIDAPERAQPWGNRAKQALSELAFGKTVEVEVTDHDRYGRTVARVVTGGIDVPAEMVRRGCAWVYRQYAKRAELYDLERVARDGKVGLWSLPEAERIAPWEWRHARRAGQHVGMPPGAAAQPPAVP